MTAKLGFRSVSDDQLDATGNNFTGARLVLASAVIWTHCFWLVHKTSGRDEVSAIIGMPISSLAVNVFFFVSGFLICQSLFHQKNVINFAAMRVARIWPALTVCTLLTIATFALVGGADAEYWTDPQTLRFAAKNLTMIQAEYDLPSIARGGDRQVVNGSLWTIPWELRCYALMAVGFAVTVERRASMVRPVLIMSIGAAVVWAVVQEYWAGFPDTSGGVMYNVDVAMRLWGCCATGALAWLERHRIVPPVWLTVGVLMLAVAEHQMLGSSLLSSPAFFLVVVLAVFGGGRLRAVSAEWPDFSYGVYIYAFPVMVLLAAVWPQLTTDHRLLAAANLAAVLPLAALSWFVVEKPALDGARRLLRRRTMPPHAAISPAE